MVSLDDFQGPYAPELLQPYAGIYAILRGRRVIDIGESGDVRSRIATHERRPCWNRWAPEGWLVAVYYTPGWPQQRRMEEEQRLRLMYQPLCGER